MLPEGERPIGEVIADNLESIRKERKLSKKDFCAVIDYGYQAYFDLINRVSQPQLKTVQKFAYQLGIKTIDLIEDWSEE